MVFVGIPLELEDLFILDDVAFLDVTGNGESIERHLTEGVTDVVKSHPVFQFLICMEIGQVIDLISVGEWSEMREEHDVVVILKGVLPDQTVQTLEVVILLWLCTIL